MIRSGRLKDIKKEAEWAMVHCGYPQTKVGTPFFYWLYEEYEIIFNFESGSEKQVSL